MCGLLLFLMLGWVWFGWSAVFRYGLVVVGLIWFGQFVLIGFVEYGLIWFGWISFDKFQFGESQILQFYRNGKFGFCRSSFILVSQKICPFEGRLWIVFWFSACSSAEQLPVHWAMIRINWKQVRGIHDESWRSIVQCSVCLYVSTPKNACLGNPLPDNFEIYFERPHSSSHIGSWFVKNRA